MREVERLEEIERLRPKEKIGVKKAQEVSKYRIMKHLSHEVVDITCLGMAYLGNSEFTIWQRPSMLQINKFVEIHGITMIVTIQGEKEKPSDIIKECNRLKLKHYNITLTDVSEETLKNKEMCAGIKTHVDTLYSMLHSSHEKVLFHCGAGIHRSGVVVYSLLRKDKLSTKQAIDIIRDVRKETAIGVGEWRIKLTEKHILTKPTEGDHEE